MELLEFIGLHKNERLIYLDLLKHGASTAVEISKRTHIHRPNTYDALRKLIEKGFISQTKTLMKNLFKAMDAEKIKNYLDQKRQEIEVIIPEIKNLSNKTAEKEDIIIAKGPFATREALLDMLEIGEEIKVFGASKEALDTFGEGFLNDFHAKRMKKKVFMRHIYNVNVADRIKKLNKMKYTAARHLSKQYDSLVSTNICGDTVVLIIFSSPVSVMTIKRKEIADAYSRYFNILWSRAK